VKDIVSELRPDLGEVRQAFFFVIISITSFYKHLSKCLAQRVHDTSSIVF
jgi:hypothetical protein